MNSIIVSKGARRLQKPIVEPIILIYQFFIHSNFARNKEIQFCLRKNVENPLISKVVLLNEKIYTDAELGTASNKIIQVIRPNRLVMSQVFDYIDEINFKGYFITCNADIFFDEHLKNIYYTNLSLSKSVLLQLRYEYKRGMPLHKCKLFGPRCDSQDSWIFHTNFNLTKKERKLLNISYGIGGCDNKFAYLFYLFGYEIINDPYFIRSYHYHTTQIRNYIGKPLVPSPYLWVIPNLNDNSFLQPRSIGKATPINWWLGAVKTTMQYYTNNGTNLTVNDSNILVNNIIQCDKNHGIMQIPRVNRYLTLLFFNYLMKVSGKDNGGADKKINEVIIMLNKDGFVINNNDDLLNYVNIVHRIYSKSPISLHSAPVRMCWRREPNENKAIMDIARNNGKLALAQNVLVPTKNFWIEHIKNKRILIISNKHADIKNQVDNKDEIYNRSIFPDCTFKFLDTPSGDTSFKQTMNRYIHEMLDSVITDIDIVLVGETPFGICLVDYLQHKGKYVIEVGDWLALYFGIYTPLTLKQYNDVIRFYLNSFWKLVKII